MKRIKLTQGKYAMVDDSDFRWLNQWRWYAALDKKNRTFYAQRHCWNKQTKKDEIVRMHRLILDAPKGKMVDHISGDCLDNRRENIRVVSHQENSLNRRIQKDNTSGFKGVHWNKQSGKWTACIQKGRVSFFLGYFVEREEAARAYDEAASKLHGEFARLNFPKDVLRKKK